MAGKRIERSFTSLFFLALFYIGTFDYKTFFKYNYCRNLKEVIIMGKSSLR